MLNFIISWSLEHRLLVIIIFLALLGIGVRAVFDLPIDAFPDTTPIQVQINTVAPSLSPLEIEQQITFPVEQAISGLPGLTMVRSISKFGLSQVTVLFEDGIGIYFARQLVMERLQKVALPDGFPRPEMGPVATGLGEIFHYLVTGEGQSLQELTTLHDWVIKPRLRSVAGVAEVNTWGGKKKQYHVLVNLNQLTKHGLVLDDVTLALRKNNLNVGGGNIALAGELSLVLGMALTTDLKEISNIVIDANNGVPIKISDVAAVSLGHEIRRGAVTANGTGEVVLGLAFMLMGENSNEVSKRLAARVKEIQKTLPKGVKIRPVYERKELVDQVIETVKKNLFEGALLVIAVLFIFLGDLRAGLIVAAAIPLSMIFAFSGMLRFGIAGSLMSLGAIDFGLVVDSSVIMVENSVKRLAEAGGKLKHTDVVRDASIEVRKPTMFGELIIMIVYLPILTLEGIEGKLFRPMALTVIFALIGSLILSLTLMPVLSSLFLPRVPKNKDNFIIGVAKAIYRPLVRLAMRWRWATVACAVFLLGLGGWLAASTGAEFVPKLSEMSLVANTVRLSGVSLDESVRYGGQMEKVLLEEFPDEIRDVWSRTGTPEVATDPMGIQLTDVFITLNPRSTWKRASTQDELTGLMREELSDFPGTKIVFTQPIEMRVNEMVAGIRTDLGIKIIGDDLDVLKKKADEVAAILETIGGSSDVYVEQITGEPVLEIEVDQDAISRYGIPARAVLEVVEAIGTKKVGEIREGQRRFDLVVRLAEEFRKSPTAIRNILIPAAGGERIPLSRLADIRQVNGPSTISREWQRRRIIVQTNIEERDIASFVAEVQERIEDEVNLPLGYHIEYGGQFEHLESAKARLMFVVPLALSLILFLLYISTNSVRDALVIFTGAPFASLGGVIALWFRDMPFTISAAVGFVAVSGVAMLNGLVMVSMIHQLQGRGVGLGDAIEQSALSRLRPVLMTALVAALGFVPMALNTGVGAEVQSPLATVVVGGVISDNILTLLVLPALYLIFGTRTSKIPSGMS